jgi:cysteine dioxygenase
MLTRLNFAQFLDELDRHEQRVPLDELVALMEALEITPEELAAHVSFGESTYKRNLVRAGSGYQALLLCWRAGQKSPIHDHRGSSCGVRVLKGVCTETVYDTTPHGMVYPVHTRHLYEGQVCGSQDSDKHVVSNLQPAGQDMMTLHVYSPPLLTMGMYSLESAQVCEFADPVHGLMHGDGI